MKNTDATSTARSYRQGARAEAAAATGERILRAFMKRIREQWFDEVTLDAVAQEAGVTVQTVVRRFTNKDGLLSAACERIRDDILARRRATPGNIPQAVDALARDYETLGDLVLRMLSQEERHPVIRIVTDTGRRSHRAWVGEIFERWLAPLPAQRRRVLHDALVVATDIYIWALLRRDMRRPLTEYRSLVLRNIEAALASATPSQEQKS